MNKQQTTLLVVGAGVVGLIAWSLIRKGRVLKNLNFGIKGIDINAKKKVVSVDFRIINPTKTAITVNSVVCDLLLNGNAVGTIKYLQDTEIVGQGETTLRLPVSVNPISIATLFTELLTSKLDKLEFKVKGVVSAENILFPVDVPYSFDLKAFKK